MGGYPYHTASSFVRHPGGYAHDAFGHVGDDDRRVRPNDVCFRKIPHTGLDISSKEPRTKHGRDNRPAQRQTPVVAPVYGKIVRAGFNQHAGNFHVIKHRDYDEWWIGGHHSAFAKSAGHVERGELIAMMGDTGGAQGVHTHWTVATSRAAADAYIDGWIQYRSGRSVAAWARQAVRGPDKRLHGLIDPWPLIEREWADEVRRLKAEASSPAVKSPEQIEEEELMGAKDEIVDELKGWIGQQLEILTSRMRRENRPEIYFIQWGEDGREYNESTAPYAAEIHPGGGHLRPLVAPNRAGQIASLRANYRLIAFDSVPQGFTERAFWNTVKDIMIGSGRLPSDTSEADGIAAAKAFFAHVAPAER